MAHSRSPGRIAGSGEVQEGAEVALEPSSPPAEINSETVSYRRIADRIGSGIELAW